MIRRLWFSVALATAIGLTLWLGGPWASESSVSNQANQANQANRASRPSREIRSDRLRVSMVARYSHDGDAFTQGLLWHDGKLYETTGQYGRSRLRRWNLETGEIEAEILLSPDLFGEGLAFVGARARASVGAGAGAGAGSLAGPRAGALTDRGAAPGGGGELIWLTWKAGRAFRFDPDGFTNLGEFAYDGEGWGLTLCNGELYRSDGSATLWRHDPETFAVRGRLEVSRGGVAIALLNELECTPRGILANIWQRDEIVRIDSLSGRVTATIDAGGLLRADERRPEAVLNGIAYRPETDTLLLTGKHWPWLFEVVLEEM